jgi:DNA-binding CsgD family transcriptional regulator
MADVLTRVAGREVSWRMGLLVPVVLTLATLVVVDTSASVLPGGGAFLLLLIPVMAGSMIGGTRAGLVALLLGAIGSIALVVTRGHPWLSAPTDLSRMLLFVLEGGFIVLVVSALRAAIQRPRNGVSTATETGFATVERLTPREVEILRLAAGGLGTDDIARVLHLSRHTVKSHLAGAYGKLGAHNRAQAIGAGVRLGYLDADALGSAPAD